MQTAFNVLHWWSRYPSQAVYKIKFFIFVASQEISADRNFWLAKVAGHGRKKFGQFGILGLEIA